MLYLLQILMFLGMRDFKFHVGLKSLVHQELSEPEFYGDLMCMFKKIVGFNNFQRSLLNNVSL